MIDSIPLEQYSRARGLIERIYWLIRLRWMAIAGVITTVIFTTTVLKLTYPIFTLIVVTAVLAFYNILFGVILEFLKRKKEEDEKFDLFPMANCIANLQISFDLTCLAVLIHFSGGIENPFIFYFVFHMIIASILLSRRASFFQATYAVVLFLLIAFLEYSGLISHHYLSGVLTLSLHNNLLYIYGLSFVFISTLYIANYMASAISSKLKEREGHLRYANAMLQEKDRIKSEYVLRVTHDIKEDLAAIQSCIEPVTERITGDLNPEQDNLLQRAKNRSKRLITYVNALLDITKLKLMKKLKMESFSLNQLASEIEEHVLELVKGKSIDLIIDISSGVSDIKGVRFYIKEAILNLVMNAIKYTEDGGRISLIVRQKRETMLIKVEDTGMGIPEKDQPYIFEELYRASNAREIEVQGTGLGLSITKQIIEMHQGRIWAESSPGRGTCFFIEIPR